MQLLVLWQTSCSLLRSSSLTFHAQNPDTRKAICGLPLTRVMGTHLAATQVVLLVSLCFAGSAALRPAGTGISCQLAENDGCEGAFWFIPATGSDFRRKQLRRVFKAPRNRPLEETLLEATATAAGPRKDAGSRESPPSGKTLAASMQRIVADPSQLEGVLSAMTRSISVSVPSSALSGSFQRRTPAEVHAGIYEMSLEYTCLGVELFATDQDANLDFRRQGNKTWAAASVHSFGTPIIMVAVDSSGLQPVPISCGKAAVEWGAIRTAAFLGSNTSSPSLTYGSECAETSELVQDTLGVRCGYFEHRGISVQVVDIDPAYALVSSATTAGLIATSMNKTRPAQVASSATRLRRWQLRTRFTGGISLSGGSTTQAARESAVATASETLPRIDDVGIIIAFTLVPALLGLVLVLGDVIFVASEGRNGLLQRPRRCDIHTLHLLMFIIEFVAAVVSMAGSVPLLLDFGRETVGGYVSLERGTVIYQAAQPELGLAWLRLTAQPVVESVIVSLGGRKGQGVVIAAVTVASVDLAWSIGYALASVGTGSCKGEAAGTPPSSHTEQ